MNKGPPGVELAGRYRKPGIGRKATFLCDVGLLAGRPNLCGSSAILDHAEVPCDSIRTYIEWIRFTGLAVCGAMGFEEGGVELGVIRNQRGCAVIGSRLRHLLRRGNVAVIICGAAIKGNRRPADVSDA